MSDKKSSAGEDMAVKVVGALALGYFVVKPILRYFGGDEDDKDSVKDQLNTAPEEDPFSHSYAPYLEDTQGDMDEYWRGAKEHSDNGEYPPVDLKDPNWFKDDVYTIPVFAEALYGSFGAFSDQRDTVFYLFGLLKSKASLAAVSAYLWANYQIDLLDFMKEGSSFLPWNGLSDADLAALIRLVNNLPEK